MPLATPSKKFYAEDIALYLLEQGLQNVFFDYDSDLKNQIYIETNNPTPAEAMNYNAEVYFRVLVSNENPETALLHCRQILYKLNNFKGKLRDADDSNIYDGIYAQTVNPYLNEAKQMNIKEYAADFVAYFVDEDIELK